MSAVITLERQRSQPEELVQSLVNLLATHIDQLADWLSDNDAESQQTRITHLRKLTKDTLKVKQALQLDSPEDTRAAQLELGLIGAILNDKIPDGKVYNNPAGPEQEIANAKANQAWQQHLHIIRLLREISRAPR